MSHGYVPQLGRGELPAGLGVTLLRLVEVVWNGTGEEFGEEETISGVDEDDDGGGNRSPNSISVNQNPISTYRGKRKR